MTREEMIAMLVKSSGGTRTKADIEAMLDDSSDEGVPIEKDSDL